MDYERPYIEAPLPKYFYPILLSDVNKYNQ